MKLLLKKLLTDIKGSKGQFISTLAVIIVGVVFYIGFNSTLTSLKAGSDQYFINYRLADLQAGYFNAPQTVVKKVQKLSFVKMATGRSINDVKVNVNGTEAIIRMISMPDKKTNVVNDIKIMTGSYFDNPSQNQCIVGAEFFKAHHFNIGDTLSPVVNRKVSKLIIKGSARSPEYVYEIKDAENMAPDSKTFGIVYVAESSYEKIFGQKDSINEISILLKKGTNIKYAEKQIEKLTGKYGLVSLTPKSNQISYSTFKSDIESLKSLGGVFPIIFLAVAAIIIFITMSRTIENQRTQIGILMALGYSNIQIISHYLMYTIIVGLSGTLIGVLGGSYCAKFLLAQFNIMYKLPDMHISMPVILIIKAFMLTMFFSIASGYFSCRKVLKVIPAEAMRPKAPPIGRNTLIEGIKFFWGRLSFNGKMITRNLFRYKKRSLLTSLGIIFCTGLMVTGIGLKSSIDGLIGSQFSNAKKYNLKINFSSYVGQKDLNAISKIKGIKTIVPVTEIGVELEQGNKKKTIGFTLLNGDSKIYGPTNEKGTFIQVPSKGIILPERTAIELNIKKGQWINIKPIYMGMKNQRIHVKVDLIVKQSLGRMAYSDINNSLDWFGNKQLINTAVIKLDKESDEHNVIKKLGNVPYVNSITSQKQTLRSILKMTASVSFMIVFIMICAGVMAFAVVYNITVINIFERKREIATLQVLGFNDSEMNSFIFNENIIITLIAALFGLPIGKLLLDYVLELQTTESMSVESIINYKEYLFAFVLTFIFTILTNVVLTRKIKSIDMVESLKSAE